MPSLLVKLAVAVLAALVALLFLCADAAARTWYITPDGTGGAATIQAGMDSAAVGDTLALACGTEPTSSMRSRCDRESYCLAARSSQTAW